MKRLIILVFISQTIFFTGCAKNSGHGNFSHDSTTQFLENLMIREGGLYTLLGSKSMTIFNVDMSFPENDFEITQYYEKNNVESISLDSSSLEDFKLECKKLANSHMNRKKLWTKWRERKSKALNSKYIITSRQSGFAEGLMGLFINVPLLEYTLVNNYELFKRETQMEFDPYYVVLEVSENSSLFWDKVFSNHFLLGILLGYGKRNSFMFAWNSKAESGFVSPENSVQRLDVQLNENVSVRDLQLPMFLSFSINDEEVQRYSQEREKIIQYYNGKSFEETTLELLEAE